MKTILTIVLILIAGAVRAQQKDTIAGNDANISKIHTQIDRSTHKIPVAVVGVLHQQPCTQ